MNQARLALLGLSAAAITAGCATTHEAVSPTLAPASVPTVIQQMGYGPAAQFVLCEGTACPVLTVKTLAHLERAPFH